MLILFIKRHRILTAIFVVCILLMIKNSSIPYFFVPPTGIAFIFDKPESDFFLGVAQMVDIFSSTYVTSLLFYYMVDFFPKVQQEKKAKEVIAPKLVSLYLYICELLAMIEYSSKRENLLQSGKLDEMDKLSIQDKEVFCKKKSFRNEDEDNTIPYSYNLLKDCDKYRKLILDICNQISGTSSFSYCNSHCFGNPVIRIIKDIAQAW